MSEETKPTKQELFESHPEKFEDTFDCLIIVKQDQSSKRVMILNKCKSIDESYIVEGYIMKGGCSYSAPSNKNKVKLFEANPDQFEIIDECLIIVKRDPETKRMQVLNNCELGQPEMDYIIKGYVHDGMQAFRYACRAKAAATRPIIPVSSNGSLKGMPPMRPRR